MVKEKFLVCVLAMFAAFVLGASVSVMEGDSVTLHTNTTNSQERIMWYLHGIRIAKINRGQSEICTDGPCKEVTERFRGRLKLDNRTGDFTITHITKTDDGVYDLSMNTISDTYFNVSVHGVSAAERDKMKRKSVKEGESVTLDPGVRNQDDVMKWCFNGTFIAEITGDQSQICTGVQCEERFRDRLKVNETGSLTIMNTRNTDTGEYKLQISNSRFSIIRSFSVNVTGSGPSAGVVAGKAVAVLLVFAVAVAGVIYCRHRNSKKSVLTEQGNVI